jgi:hypothetical protein
VYKVLVKGAERRRGKEPCNTVFAAVGYFERPV